MIPFKKVNPSGKRECVVTACATLLKMERDEFIRKAGYHPSARSLHTAFLCIKERGLANINRMYDGCKYDGATLKTFIEENPKGKFLIRVSRHALAVEDGVLIDTSYKLTRRIKNIYVVR